jgi:hypothetical protein
MAAHFFDQRANVFDTPRRRPCSDLDRPGKPPVTNALPPSRFANGNDRRDWWLPCRIANNLDEAQVTDFWEFVHAWVAPV